MKTVLTNDTPTHALFVNRWALFMAVLCSRHFGQRVVQKDNQMPLVGPWGVVPKRFTYKLALIHARNLTTKFHHFPNLKIELVPERHGHSLAF